MAGAVAAHHLYPCRDCGGEYPLSGMAREKARNGKARAGARCRTCQNRFKRAQERRLASAPRDEHGNVVEEVGAPDPAPARTLRELLADSRRIGLDFATAWAGDTPFALRLVRDPNKRRAWREAFEGTRRAWEAAWHGEAGPGATLTPELMDDFRSMEPPGAVLIAG